ncbi:hypothetical protein ACWY4P_02685 [Streptomyces sp. LZ34]
MDDLRYKMIMALSAADLGSPICEQVAAICAEVADQHCAQLHIDAHSSRSSLPEIVVPAGVQEHA